MQDDGPEDSGRGDLPGQDQGPQYVGFWARTCAALIDTVLVLLIILPISISIYGWPELLDTWKDLLAASDLQELREIAERRDSGAEEPGITGAALDILVTWVLPAIAVIFFWIAKQATPGKMVFSAIIVDSTSGEAPRAGQLIGRYLAYFVALLPLGLGILWVGIDKRKQGLHDKLAGTVVVRKRK